jgi:Ca2+-transporting ATPase
LILQLVIIYVPFFNLVFRTFPLRWEELAVCTAGAAAIIFITEVKKLFLRKKQDFITA